MKNLKLNKAIFYFLFFAFITSSCSTTGDLGCIDESQIVEGPCTMEYNPVCGCDGKTYSNPCQANRNGLVSWDPGTCDQEPGQ